jgi:hypothetical protein
MAIGKQLKAAIPARRAAKGPRKKRTRPEPRQYTVADLERARDRVTDAHHSRDVAVAAAYNWPSDISEDDALAKLLELNLSRAAVVKAGQAEDVVDDLLTEED